MKKEYLKSIQSWRDIIKKTSAPDERGEDFELIKNSLQSDLQHHIDSLKAQDFDEVDSSTVHTIDDILNKTINEDWIDGKLGNLKEESQKYLDKINKGQSQLSEMCSNSGQIQYKMQTDQ